MQVAQAVGPGSRAAPGHVVQFYGDEDAFAQELARFFQPVRDGRAEGIAVVTPEHCRAVHAAAHGIRVLDARATLDAVLVDGWPDPQRFEAAVGAPVRALAAGGPLCAFGEMVALLCADGRPDAAVALERLWNALGKEVGFRLLCAYPLGAFTSLGALSEVLKEHESSLGSHEEALAPPSPAEAGALLEAEQQRRQGLERALAAREAELRDFVAHAAESREALQRHEAQQAAVARLGREALAHPDLDALFGAAVREVAATLGVEYVGLLELDPDGHHLAFRAGHGWRPGLVGHARVPAGQGSHAARVLASKGPHAYHGLDGDLGFAPGPLLKDHGCHSGVSVAIATAGGGVFGTLGAHTARPRRFSADDANFLSAVAHVLASAIERRCADDELQSSRAHLEETVAERTRQLAASNRELEAFSYSVSHDLRAPLRTISGYASILEAKHGPELSDPARQLLEGVRKGADRLGRLIDDLLDLSRVQRVDLVRQAVDLSALANSRLRELGASDPSRRVEVRVGKGLRVTGDPRLLGMMLDNLLGNAWKFTRHAERARIEVGRQGAGPDAVFFVKDNGAGFDMAFASRLFQPFQRLHGPQEFEGTGVGLATVQRIVERHGGRVWAEGRVGEGAALYFTLGQ